MCVLKSALTHTVWWAVSKFVFLYMYYNEQQKSSKRSARLRYDTASTHDKIQTVICVVCLERTMCVLLLLYYCIQHRVSIHQHDWSSIQQLSSARRITRAIHTRYMKLQVHSFFRTDLSRMRVCMCIRKRENARANVHH